MGDVAMTVPVIKALITQYPKCKITVVSKPFLKPLFDGLLNVSFVKADVKNRHKGLIGLIRLFCELKKKNITYVADFHGVLRSKILTTFFKSYRVPTASIDKGRSEKKALTRSKNKVFKQLKTSHQRYADVLNKLGFPINLSNPKPMTKKFLSKKVNSFTGLKKEKWVGIAPFAAFEGKIYPFHLMEKVILTLATNGLKIFLFGGGENEIKQLSRFEKKHHNVINIAGKFSFAEELELISSLDLMISMDSGNAHLAAVQQIKTITLWGVTHPFAGFAPWYQPPDYCLLSDIKMYPKLPCSIYGNKVFEGYENVMETIDPKKVINKAMAILNS